MWNWLNCYLSGRHDYGVTCSSGSIYLRCIHCGKRSEGWTVHQHQQPIVAATLPAIELKPAKATLKRALPFTPREVVPERRSA